MKYPQEDDYMSINFLIKLLYTKSFRNNEAKHINNTKRSFDVW